MNKQSMFLTGCLVTAMLASACGVVTEDGEVAASGSALTFAGMTGAQAEAARALPGLRELHVDARGLPSYVAAELGVLRSDAALRDGDLAALSAKLAPLLRMHSSVELAVRRTFRDMDGKAHVRLAQTIDGIEVVGAEIIVHADAKSGAIESIQFWHLPDEGLPRVPKIGANAIFAAIAPGELESDARPASAPKLAYLRTADGRGTLGWQIELSSAPPKDPCPGGPPSTPPPSGIVFVDGDTGHVLRQNSYARSALFREVYTQSPATLCEGAAQRVLQVAESGTPPTPITADAYNFSGAAYNFLFDNFMRNSWDGNGANMVTVITSVNADKRSNSHWVSAGYDSYAELGTGDGVKFGSFAHSLDVVAHEFGHGVVDKTANLSSNDESGALDESFADVFGVATKVHERGIDADTWKIGAEIFTPSIPGDAIRYLNNPALDAGNFRPYVSSDYYPYRLVNQPNDALSHFNSGISNLAFYLMSQGGTHPRLNTGVTVAPLGITAAQRIYFNALSWLNPDSTFVNMREATALAATPAERVSVCKAWDAVGVPSSPSCPPAPPPLQPVPPMPTNVHAAGEHCRGLNTVTWHGSGSTFRIWSYLDSHSDRGVRIFDGEVSPAPAGPNEFERAIISGDGAIIRVQACNASGCSDISTSLGIATASTGCS